MIYVNDNINAIFINENFIKDINFNDVIVYKQSVDNLKLYTLDNFELLKFDDIVLGN